MKLATFAVAAAGFALTAIPAKADAVSDFYKGKRMEMLVGYSSGGGYDTYARLIANHMGKHIPGNPSFVARNVEGAGSLRLMNELYNIRPKDGTQIGTVGRGVVQEELWGGEGVKFKAAEMNWIGSANDEVSVCVVWKDVPVNTLEEFLNTPLIVGGTGPGADTDTFPQVLNNVVGTKLKLITGYPGGNDINLAMERGEVQGRCGWSWSSVVATRSDWLKNKQIRVILQMSVNKHPDMPDVPFVMDLAKSERDKKILQLIFARQAMGRPYVAPPKVPAERVAALRAAFMATMKDKEFMASAEKAKLEITPVSGDAVQSIITEMYSAPAEIIEASKLAASDQSKIEISKAVVKLSKHSGKIEALGNGNREVTVGGKKFSISGSRTKVTVNGSKATRNDLKAGMSCEVEGGPEAVTVSCK